MARPWSWCIYKPTDITTIPNSFKLPDQKKKKSTAKIHGSLWPNQIVVQLSVVTKVPCSHYPSTIETQTASLPQRENSSLACCAACLCKVYMRASDWHGGRSCLHGYWISQGNAGRLAVAVQSLLGELEGHCGGDYDKVSDGSLVNNSLDEVPRACPQLCSNC